MSVKKLFGDHRDATSHGTNTVIPLTSLSGVAVSGGVESPRLLEAKQKYDERYIPQINFATCSNFAIYGSAKEYYNNATYRIYATYPYDGSKAERLEWHNSSSYFENYVFDNEYPRTNGYALFSPTSDGWGTLSGSLVGGLGLSNIIEYIQFKGGPHTSDRRQGDSLTGSQFTGDYKDGYANVYHTASNRQSNLHADFGNGVTIEFWLKKAALVAEAKTTQEHIFDMWNGETGASKARLRVYLDTTAGSSDQVLKVAVVSGSTGGTLAGATSTYLRPGTLIDGSWHHVALVLKNGSSALECEAYVDGVYRDKMSGSATLGVLSSPHIANIGAARTPNDAATTYVDGYGKLSGSLDDFRFWKKARTAEQIGRFYFVPVQGATNNDLSNDSDLGVYYKFNDSITGDNTYDTVVLDYAGRVTNGTWTVTGSSGATFTGTVYRSTGSAIVESGVVSSEFKDPILYPSHADVQTYITASEYSASFHDDQNGNMIYHSIPNWVLEEDAENGFELRKMCQIMGSYMDTLYLQIQELPKLRHVTYTEDVSGSKPFPFMKHMLAGMGFEAPDLFTEVSAFQRYFDRDESVIFEETLADVKNLIYRNIYNNLTYIYKTKGTEKSFRNLIRCFGVDDEIYKLNIYGSNVTYDLKNRFKSTATKQNYLDFYETTWPAPTSYAKTNATVYLTGTAIPGVVSSSGMPTTYECEVKFPRKIRLDEDVFVPYSDLTASVFGVKTVGSDSAFTESGELFRVWIEKQGDAGDQGPPPESEDVRFYCSGSTFGVLTSSIYKDVYNGEEWLLAVSFETDKETDLILDSYESSAAIVRFRGANTAGDYVANFFEVTGAVSLANHAANQVLRKRPWCGARRTNFSGTLGQQTDVRIGAMRGYLAALTDDEVKIHARDAQNQGRLRPSRNAFLSNTMGSNNYVPNYSTLIYSWDFETVTTASADSTFAVQDVSSGSATTSRFPDTTAVSGGAALDNILSRKFEGTGYGFKPTATAVDRDYVLSGRLQLPELVASSDQIAILSQDDINFTRTTRPTNTVAYLEKSMYQIISEDMLAMFAGITEFNNLIGEPVNKYRQEYKGLNLLRRIYFSKVGNTPSIEKFISYYKWLDDSVSQVLRQVLPMSSDVPENISNVVESHILERNKYWNKFPTLEFKQDDPEGSVRGVHEMRYPWKQGHKPISGDNHFWNHNRKKHNEGSSPTVAENDRESIRQVATTRTNPKIPDLSGSSGAYSGSIYALRSYSQPYKLNVGDPTLAIDSFAEEQTNLGKQPKLHNQRGSSQVFGYHRQALGRADSTSYIEIDYHQEPYFKAQEEKAQDLADRTKRLNTRAKVWRNGTFDTGSYDSVKSSIAMPFTIYSSSVSTGYVANYRVENTSSFDFNDLHHDRSGWSLYEGSTMQSPFTEKFVGGLQYRHQDLNFELTAHKGTNDLHGEQDRGEGWYLRTPGQSAVSFFTILSESFDTTTGGWTTGSWTISTSGSATPTSGSGPSALARIESDATTGGFVFVERSAVTGGADLYLYTPVLDAVEASDLTASSGLGTGLSGSFYYHMYGADMGRLELQISKPSSPSGSPFTLNTGSANWDTLTASYNGTEASHLLGQQQTSAGASWRKATFNIPESHFGKKFYLRLKYTTMIGLTLGDVAIDSFHLGAYDVADFRLYDINYTDAARPRSTYYRDETSKRPVNIRNIRQYTGSRTYIGNYSSNYEIVQTSDASINNFWLKKNEGTPANTRKMITSSFISIWGNLGPPNQYPHVGSPYAPPGSPPPFAPNMKMQPLADRTASAATVTLSDGAAHQRHINKNKSIIVERFSAPGGWREQSRGYLDVESEQYAPNNALPWRNIGPRGLNQSNLTTRFNIRQFGNDDIATATEVADSYIGKGTDPNFKFYTSTYTANYLPPLKEVASHAFVGESATTTSGYTEVFDHTTGGATTNTWSSAITTLPFDFVLGGKLIKAGDGWCVSKNGLITFDTSVAGETVNTNLNVNASLPHANMPDNTIVAFWDSWDGEYLGNDKNYVKVVGKYPYRQYVIKGYSTTYDEDDSVDGSADGNFVFWAVILEEGTNNIYFVEISSWDDDIPATTLDSTVGAQHSTNRAEQTSGSPSVTMGSTNGSDPDTWNTHTFTHKGYGLWASHKNQKNPARSAKFTGIGGYSDNSYSVEIDYDNAYITRPIPQSDRQYSWVTSSILSQSTYSPLYFPLGYFDGEYAELHGDPVLFMSSSDVGAAFGGSDATAGWYYGGNLSIDSTLFIPNDHVGLNSLIYEPISASTNTVGYPLTAFVGLVDGADQGTYPYKGGLVFKSSGASFWNGFPKVLNGILNHRNGPYGWPIFKQWRHNDHPLIKFKRKNNIIDFHINMVQKLEKQNGPHLKMKQTSVLIPFSESAVVGRYRPVSHLVSTAPEGVPERDVHRIALRHSYANNLCTFSNVMFNKLLNFDRSGEAQVFDTIYDMYSNLEDSVNSPVSSFLKFKYREVVFPTEINMYRAKVRGRTAWTETTAQLYSGSHRTFWRDKPSDRMRAGGATLVTSSFGDTAHGYDDDDSLSVWSTDVADNGITSDQANLLTGELIHGGVVRKSDGSATHITDSDLGPDSFWESRVRMLAYGDWFDSHDGTTATAVHALRPSTVHTIAGRGPLPDNYADWANDIRTLGQDYSVVPEFKISDHMEYYVDTCGGDFFRTNRKILDLPGATGSSTSATTQTEKRDWKFYSDYSNSDFMKYFDFFQEKHDGIGKISTISLTCRGIKKLLPYKGFYPQDRALQLGTIFSSSYAEHLGGGSNTTDSTAQLNTVMIPVMSPGVLLNSMKAGVAVDFPIYTGSNTIDIGPGTTTTYNKRVIKRNPDYRIPFETVCDMTRNFPKIQKETRLGGVTTNANTIMNHYTLSKNAGNMQWAGWNGEGSPLYEMAAHNFVAEIPRFFLQGGGLTRFVSKQVSNAKPMASGSTYFMDVCLWMSDDMVISEGPRQSVSGGLGARGITYGPPLSASWGQMGLTSGSAPTSASLAIPVVGKTPHADYVHITDPNYCAWTPPYFYGKATARLAFSPHSASIMDEDTTAVFELQEILSHCKVTYLNSNPLHSLKSGDGATQDNLLSKNWMNVSASVKLFEQFKPPALSFNSLGRITSARQDLFEGLDVWKIATRWECPVLNYSQGSVAWSGSVDVTATTSSANASDLTIDKGSARTLWNTYGRIPSGSSGLFLSLEESHPTTIFQLGAMGTMVFPMPNTGSLLDYVGLEAGAKRVGEIANQKEISEAVVVVPYISKADGDKDSTLQKRLTWNDSLGKYFFKINKLAFLLQAANKEMDGFALPADLAFPGSPQVSDTTYTDLAARMRRYYMPPPMDFITNIDISPFVMYMFEFTHTMDKQDLANMWQGILPDIGVSSQREDVTITHRTSQYEFFDGMPVPPNVRWMVFKVKKKAATSFYDVQEDQFDFKDDSENADLKKLAKNEQQGFNFPSGRKTPEYTYNWPYDFFSLVELVQLESEILIEPKQNE